MTLFSRKPKTPPARPELLELAQRVRDVDRVLIGWNVRGSGIEDLNGLLGEVHRVLVALSKTDDEKYRQGWVDAMLQENVPEATGVSNQDDAPASRQENDA